jgi:hypothetical protein
MSLGPGDHTDGGVRGLQLRVRAKRGGFSRVWLFRYRWRDEGTAIAMRRQLESGIDPRRGRTARRIRPAPLPLSSAVVGSEHSIEHLISEFTMRYLRPTRKRPEYAEQLLARDVAPIWPGRDVRSIRPAEVISLLDGIVDRGSRVMSNRVAAVLGQLFRFAIHRGRGRASNPASAWRAFLVRTLDKKFPPTVHRRFSAIAEIMRFVGYDVSASLVRSTLLKGRT